MSLSEYLPSTMKRYISSRVYTTNDTIYRDGGIFETLNSPCQFGILDCRAHVQLFFQDLDYSSTDSLSMSSRGKCCASSLRRLSYCHILRKRLILFRPSFIPSNYWKTPEISFAFMCSVDHNTSSSTANCYCSSHTDFLALGSSPCKMLLASGTLCT